MRRSIPIPIPILGFAWMYAGYLRLPLLHQAVAFASGPKEGVYSFQVAEGLHQSFPEGVGKVVGVIPLGCECTMSAPEFLFRHIYHNYRDVEVEAWDYSYFEIPKGRCLGGRF